MGGLNNINNMLQYTDEKVADCNDCKVQRIYQLTNPSNKPSFMTSFILKCEGDNYLKSQYATDETNVIAYRAYYNGKWSDWRKI